ncbi:MAG: peptide chain release factor N(5)-glutamine methyltransferase [Candidatus Marinimicrobia bacterium]|nr:peptide chain release factor N(5)-glutamine methyltransferase [Candidatus Neomarinimicrobiota bacterium]
MIQITNPSPTLKYAPQDKPFGSAQNGPWRIIDLLQWGTRYFTDKDIPNARLEVEWLLADQLAVARVDLYVRFDQPLTPSELANFKAVVQRRLRGEPFQYIIGKAPFYGRDFTVTPQVLIPRPETEVIIQALQKGPPPTTILDLGTGSGCLAVTAGLLYPGAEVLAVDNSTEALALAKENAHRLGAGKITFQELDMLKAMPQGKFDAVLCNPPYVPAEEVASLQREIREHEPRAALTDGGDGLTYFRRLAEMGPGLIGATGRLLVEIGGKPQAGPVKALFERAGMSTEMHHDLQGDPRVVEVVAGTEG